MDETKRILLNSNNEFTKIANDFYATSPNLHTDFQKANNFINHFTTSLIPVLTADESIWVLEHLCLILTNAHQNSDQHVISLSCSFISLLILKRSGTSVNWDSICSIRDFCVKNMFTSIHITRLLSKILKAFWLEDFKINSDIVLNIVKTDPSTLNTTDNVSPDEVLLCILDEVISTNKSQSLSKTRRVSNNFRDTCLLEIFNHTLNNIYNNDQINNQLLDDKLSIIIKCLSFDFMGSFPDESGEEHGTIMLPTSWKALNDLQIFKHFFNILFHNDVCFKSKNKVLHSLVLFASIRRSYFKDKIEREKFLAIFIENTLCILNTIQGECSSLSECPLDIVLISRLISRLNAYSVLADHALSSVPEEGTTIQEYLTQELLVNFFIGVESFTRQVLVISTIDSGLHGVTYLLNFWSGFINTINYKFSMSNNNITMVPVDSISQFIVNITIDFISLCHRFEEDEDESIIDTSLEIAVDYLLPLFKLKNSFHPIINHLWEIKNIKLLRIPCAFLQSHLVEDSIVYSHEYVSLFAFIINTSHDDVYVYELIRRVYLFEAGRVESSKETNSLRLSVQVDQNFNSTLDMSNEKDNVDLAKLHTLKEGLCPLLSNELQTQISENMSNVDNAYSSDIILNLLLYKLIPSISHVNTSVTKRYLLVKFLYDFINGVNVVVCNTASSSAHRYSRVPNILVTIKLIAKNQIVNSLLKNHTHPDTFLYSSCTLFRQDNNRHDLSIYHRTRTTYYAAITKLFLHSMNEEEDHHSELKPVEDDLIFNFISPILNNSKSSVCDVFRDLRGVAMSITNSINYNNFLKIVFDNELFKTGLSQNVTVDNLISVLRFCAEISFNRNHRLNLEHNSTSGVLIFRNLVGIGECVLSHVSNYQANNISPSSDMLYLNIYKPLILLLESLTRTFEGDYINFGIFELYGDNSLDKLIDISMVLSSKIDPFEIQTRSKITKIFYNYFEIVCKEEFLLKKLCGLDYKLLKDIINVIIEGISSNDSNVSSDCCLILDSIFTHLWTFRLKIQKYESETLFHLKDQMSRIMRLLYNSIISDAIGSVISPNSASATWAISRPLYIMIVLNKDEFIKNFIDNNQHNTEKVNELVRANLTSLSYNGLGSEERDAFSKGLHELYSGLKK